MPVFYEVSLEIQEEIYTDFYSWLVVHIQEMLELPGFVSHKIMKVLDVDTRKLVVTYELKSYEDMQNYFNVHAKKMRGDGVNKFAGKFSATRRVLEKI